ncbi:MAG: hypothetical protein CL677_09480 [Bdellovibrionaceae bacterium]|nr:hypothetical protein [Pseudobdellovibrionaceae bacterium]|tara:strand:+ start:30781 stop:32319 length:1539 start_codon:yes stop_codon:yes gene_type:complete
MNFEQFWGPALGIDNQQLEEWRQQAPDGTPLITWCIYNQLIDENQYLNWAKDYFGLAALKNEFFEGKFNPYLLQNLKDSEWSENFIPVAHWDDVLFVACAEPQQSQRWPMKVQFVLAPPTYLKKTFEQYGNTDETSDSVPGGSDSNVKLNTAESDLSEAPTHAGIDLSEVDLDANSKPTDEIELGTDLSAFEVEEDPSNQNESIEASTDHEDDDHEMPDGLSLDLGALEDDSAESSTGFDFSNLGASSEEESEENNSDMESVDGPPPPSDEALKFNAGSTVEPDVSDELEATVISKRSPENDDDSVDDTLKTSEAQPPEPPPESKKVDLDDAFAKSIIDEIQQINNQKGPEGQISVASPDDLSDANNLEEKLAWFFTQALESYNQSMILNVSDSEFKVWRWDHTWNPKDNQVMTVEGKKPSLFRIVLRTKKSYHGPINDSPIHKSFFESWGCSKTPEVITAIPIVLNEEVKHLWLLVGSKDENEAVKSLSNMETIAMQLPGLIDEIDEKQAA